MRNLLGCEDVLKLTAMPLRVKTVPWVRPCTAPVKAFLPMVETGSSEVSNLLSSVKVL